MNEHFPELIARECAGEQLTIEELMPRVYQQLRSLAGARVARMTPGQTLDATSLVHEAWLRLRESGSEVTWEHERHFFGAAARAMRLILVNRARSKNAERRGGSRLRVPFTDEFVSEGSPAGIDVLALDGALERLAIASPDKAEIVSLRFFGGLTVAEVADLLDCSVSTIEKEWRFIRAWLRTELRRAD